MPRILVGVDSVEISRMEKAMKRDGFRRRIFSAGERDYFAGKFRPAQSAAGHFAAKEALLKAMGTGITTMEMWELGVDHDIKGAPFYRLTGWAAELAAGWKLSLSITHSGDIATAFAVAYKDEEA